MPAPRFTVTVPATWFALDLDPRTRTASIARLVEERLGPAPAPQLRRELTATLRQYARQAAGTGAAYAALMYQVVDGSPLSASLLIAVAAAPGGATPLASALGAASPTELHTLAGPAARAATQLGGTLQVQYALAVPGSELAVTMTFATPNLAQAEPLTLLFDAIARTLEWAGR